MTIFQRIAHYRTFLKDDRNGVYQANDAAENESGRLPEEEGLQIPVVWAIELFTPSQVGRLTAGLRGLGWERGKSRDENLVEWTENARRGRSRGWASLGRVTDKRKTQARSERTATFPAGIDSAHPVLISLTPSITALIVGFFLTDEKSRSLEGPLRKTYSTYTVKNPLLRARDIFAYIAFGAQARFSRTIKTPHHQRRDSLETGLEQLEGTCVSWIKANLPGVFASGIGGEDLPTAVLLITEKFAPATDDFFSVPAFEGLSISRVADRWVSTEWPGAALILSTSLENNKRRMAFTCRRYDALPERPYYHDRTSNFTIASQADEAVQGVLARWALSRVLDGYDAELAVLRDKSAGSRKYHAVRDLKALRSLVRHRLYDAMVTAQEIEEFASDSFSYSRGTFAMHVTSQDGTPYYLADGMRRSQAEYAKRIIGDADLLQSVLSTTSNISQTISNLRIQYVIIFLTLASIAIAAWALKVSITTGH